MVILNTKFMQIPQRLVYENFTYTKKCYVYEIAAVDLSKFYFLKNAKKTCKPNNRESRLSNSNSYKQVSIACR